MILFYNEPSNIFCLKARAWLQQNQIEFKERRISSNPLTDIEFKNMLQLTEVGTSELISTRSKAFQELKIDLEILPLNELLIMIQQHPSLLRQPIIMDDKKLVVGYNEDDIRCFIPRKLRREELEELNKEINTFSTVFD